MSHAGQENTNILNIPSLAFHDYSNRLFAFRTDERTARQIQAPSEDELSAGEE